MPYFLFRPGAGQPLQSYDEKVHSVPCAYLGGDAGPEVIRENYVLVQQQDRLAIFFHQLDHLYYVAVQVGDVVWQPWGATSEQELADLLVGKEVEVCEALAPFDSWAGPYCFFNLLFALEAGPVTPREARTYGYEEEDYRNLLGRVRACPFASLDAALAQAEVIRAYETEAHD